MQKIQECSMHRLFKKLEKLHFWAPFSEENQVDILLQLHAKTEKLHALIFNET